MGGLLDIYFRDTTYASDAYLWDCAELERLFADHSAFPAFLPSVAPNTPARTVADALPEGCAFVALTPEVCTTRDAFSELLSRMSALDDAAREDDPGWGSTTLSEVVDMVALELEGGCGLRAVQGIMSCLSGSLYALNLLPRVERPLDTGAQPMRMATRPA